MSTSWKFEVIHNTLQEKDNRLSVKMLCDIAGVSRSGYYRWVNAADVRKEKENKDRADFKLILKAYNQRGFNKGARSIYMCMLHWNPPVVMNLKKIRRLMEKYGLKCPIRKANHYRRMAKAIKTNNVAGNLGEECTVMGDKNYIYYAEGQCEEKLLKVLKINMQLIRPGKISKYNVIQEKLKMAQLRTLKKGTTAVLVFDTDTTDNTNILKENIDILNKHSAVSKVICITQVENLEDEIVRSCNVNKAQELTNSKSVSSFKTDFIKASDLKGTLEKHKFCFYKLWCKSSNKGQYKEIVNEADKIRLKVR